MIQKANNENENRGAGFEYPSKGQQVVKRGRGRPKGSKNKPKFLAQPVENWDEEAVEMTRLGKIEKAKSVSMHRKWQREYIKPQFVLNRKEAYEIFFKYLRSAAGKDALRDLMVKGSPGVGKLNDSSLARYLERTSLLSRYPHEVVIRG